MLYFKIILITTNNTLHPKSLYAQDVLTSENKGKTKAWNIMKNKLKNNIKLIMFVNYAAAFARMPGDDLSAACEERVGMENIALVEPDDGERLRRRGPAFNFLENHLANILTDRGHFSSRFIRSHGRSGQKRSSLRVFSFHPSLEGQRGQRTVSGRCDGRRWWDQTVRHMCDRSLDAGRDEMKTKRNRIKERMCITENDDIRGESEGKHDWKKHVRKCDKCLSFCCFLSFFFFSGGLGRLWRINIEPESIPVWYEKFQKHAKIC